MILMNDFRRQWEDTREAVLGAVAAVGESGWYITGAELKAFEQMLASRWTLAHCAGTASGLDAIEMSLRALGCRPGDRVLTTPLSAFATTLAIVKIGAVPVFADTDRFGLIDLEECERVLSRRPEIRYLVPVHLYGNALDLEHLAELQRRFGLTIVEDCAQSILASYKGCMTGTVGRAAATSFYPTKNLGAMGDAGAVLTPDEKVRLAVCSLRDYGQSSKYRHDVIGYNSRMDELHASILRRAYLPRLESWTEWRRRIACRYLAGISHPGIRMIGEPEGSRSCFHLFPVIVRAGSKPSFMDHLKQHGIASGEHYPVLIPDQKAMAAVPYETTGELPRAREIAAGEVSLPIHPYMTEEEAGCVIEACNGWAG